MFTGFSPDSFEQLVRALSLSILGNGVTAFGNGPDGGREAAFRGKVPFPHPPSDTWDGYGVIQAKFKERREDTKTEQKWAAKQLKNELARWTIRGENPKYYIFCTNVDLTSASGGGRETLERLLASHSPKFVGTRIWDSNQLIALLDINGEVRRRFVHHLCPGDLLHEFARLLDPSPTTEATLSAYLCRELLGDREARLSQAGNRNDQFSLANVFIDLPTSTTLSDEPSATGAASSVALILRSAERKCDPAAMQDHVHAPSSGQHFARYVFLGGPGSGKSTIGQYIAQLHRAALLDRHPSNRLEEHTKSAIAELKAGCGERSINWPITPRYPIRIELRLFAKYLSSFRVGGGSLSHYIRTKLSADQYEIHHLALRQWLGKVPWLLILDGLDEVPASSNRREVLEAVRAFMIEARDVEADIMIIATSRPDGYSNEFSGDEVLQLYLRPLDKQTALKCAEKYLDAKFGAKTSRTTEAMATLSTAIEGPLVEMLMRSPLQVTFMVTVVAASGKPSESRWQLFDDYYRIIYERELQKAIPPFEQILNERRQDIEALHHRVGFLLQCRAEQSGGTQAELPIRQFRQLVNECLSENGLVEKELQSQTDLIVEAAQQRLVFLTCRTPGRMSFDIRSLQEYMAASCILSDDSETVLARLDTIAHSVFWRNTALFVVGGIFADTRFRTHRDKIRILCDNLNRREGGDANLLLGSQLALAVLETGITLRVPVATRNLADCALLLIGSGAFPQDLISRLGQAYVESMKKEFLAATSLHISSVDASRTVSAWLLVLVLARRNVDWAIATLNERWPDEIERATNILAAWLRGLTINSGALFPIESRLIERFVQRAGLAISAQTVLSVARTSDARDLGPLTLWVTGAERSEVELSHSGCRTGLQVSWRGISRGTPDVVETRLAIPHKDDHGDWRSLAELLVLCRTLNKKSASKILEVLAERVPVSEYPTWGRHLPWPVGVILITAGDKATLSAAAAEMADGTLGDIFDWRAVEDELQNGGAIKSLFALSKPRPMVCGFTGLSVSTPDDPTANHAVVELFSRLTAIPDLAQRRAACMPVLFYAECTRTLGRLSPQELEDKIAMLDIPTSDCTWTLTPADFLKSPAGWTRLFNVVGNRLDFSKPIYQRDRETPLDELLSYIQDPTENIGAIRLAMLWLAIGDKLEYPPVWLPWAASHSDERLRVAGIMLSISALADDLAGARRLSLMLTSAFRADAGLSVLRLATSILGNATPSSAVELVATDLSLAVQERNGVEPSGLCRVRLTLARARNSQSINARGGAFKDVIGPNSNLALDET